MAMPVEIVRPNHSIRTLGVMFLANIASLLFSAWIAMLLQNYEYKLWSREQS